MLGGREVMGILSGIIFFLCAVAVVMLILNLIVGILGSLIFIGLLIYRLNHGRKAVRLGSASSSACGASLSALEGRDRP